MAPEGVEPGNKKVLPSMTIGEKADHLSLELLPVKLTMVNLSEYYKQLKAPNKVSIDIPENKITALIGQSGCGKSTLLRLLNRMTDLIHGCRVEGQVILNGKNIYDPDIDVVDIRQLIGMVFQRPNTFPVSVFDNVAYGARLYGIRNKRILEKIVERSLCHAAVWDDVKDKLYQSGLALSGGQQQRVCMARAIAVEHAVILMDEPASALDPISTLKIEELMENLKTEFNILIMTHNLQQEARVSDFTAVLMVDQDQSGSIVKIGTTNQIFTTPKHQQTKDYVTGRFG
jgi:phosphate transport system ATP-binding protein